jgi:hypothetical protein
LLFLLINITMELLQRAKESGRVIPSLVAVEDGAIEVDGFGADLLGLLDGAGTSRVETWCHSHAEF